MPDITRGYTFTDANPDWSSNKATALRLNKMVDDAKVNIIAGANITISRNDDGINISAASGGAGSPGYYGVFYDSTDQVAAAANTAYAVKLNNTVESIGVNISNNSRINIVNGGTYDLQFSLQLNNTDSQIHDVDIWLRKNGTDVVATNSVVSVPEKHGSVDGHLLPAWNFVFTAAANDYYELMWSTTNTAITIETLPAGTTPVTPLTPSAIVTITQVVNIAAPGSITAGQIASVNAGTIIGTINANQINSINANQIIGTITAGQIGSINANQIAGTITSSQIGSVTAGSIIGTISSTQIGSVSASTIIGTLNSGQISSVNASAITGSISSTQIGSVAATTITGSITSGQIGSVSASTINGVIVTSQLADQILNTQRLIASDISVVRRLASLPTLPNTSYPNDCLVLNTTNKTLYQNVSGTWTVVTSSSSVTGTLTSNDIASVNANTINGLIIASQIGSVNASAITGSISSTQIGSVNATAITGSITSGQIASVNASAITGSITATQISSVNASAIAGSITSSQISSVNASAITGSITSSQISSVSASSITGSITSSQISSVSATTITGTLTSTQIGSINANTITIGLIQNDQINSINAGKLTAGTITATVSLESPKIAVAGACYNAASYTSNTFGSTTLTVGDDGTTKPSGFDSSSPSYLTIADAKLYGWGHSSGSYGNRYGRSDPKISVFAVGEFSGVGSGDFAAYAIEYSTDGGTTWGQVTAIDASVHYPQTFISVSGALELTGMSALGSVDFRFKLVGTNGGNPTFEYGQIQVLCYNF